MVNGLEMTQSKPSERYFSTSAEVQLPGKTKNRTVQLESYGDTNSCDFQVGTGQTDSAESDSNSLSHTCCRYDGQNNAMRP